MIFTLIWTDVEKGDTKLAMKRLRIPPLWHHNHNSMSAVLVTTGFAWGTSLIIWLIIAFVLILFKDNLELDLNNRGDQILTNN